MNACLPGDRTLLHLIQPISELLGDSDVTDIVVNKPCQVGVRRSGKWQFIHSPSFDFDTLDAATILIGQRTGREFDEANPYVNSTLPGGQRFQGVRPPGTKPGRILWAIRRPPAVARKLDDPDFDDLTSEVNTDMARRQISAFSVATAFKNKDWREVFIRSRLAGLSIGFCGAMGDGKSDMVRRTMQVSRPESRMLTVETDDECGDTGPENKAPLYYDDLKINSDEAVRIAKRLVPDDIIMQEVRGPEAWSLLVMMNAGVSGLTTWHSDEGKEHEALAEMARSHTAVRDMKDEVLLEKAGNAFDVIAYCRRNTEKKFRISSIRLMAAEREMKQ